MGCKLKSSTIKERSANNGMPNAVVLKQRYKGETLEDFLAHMNKPAKAKPEVVANINPAKFMPEDPFEAYGPPGLHIRVAPTTDMASATA